MLDQLRQIAIFARTAEHGSFQGAAVALRLSPSVVSYHVSQLEAHLGVALLYRSTRRLALTPEGDRLLTSAQAMLAAADEGLTAIGAGAEEPSGPLRVTLPAVLAGFPITDRLAAFAVRHPKIRLTLDYADARRDLIRDGFDMSIRMGWLRDSALVARKLGEETRALVAAPALAARHERPETPEDLMRWPWLELQASPHRPVHLDRGADRAALRPTATLEVNEAQAMARLARGGAGLAVLPTSLVQADLADGRLVEPLPEWRPTSIGVFAVWPPNAPRDGLARRLVSHLAETSDPGCA